MTIRFINKNSQNQSTIIKFEQNCTICDVKPKQPNSIYEEAPYSVKHNKNKNIVLNDTQYKIIKSLAKGMHYDFCDAWDDDKVLTMDDLEMAYKRFKQGENIFGMKIKKFDYFKNLGVAEITTESGEYLCVDFETKFEKENKNCKIIEHNFWQKNGMKTFSEWKKDKGLEDFLYAIGARESENDYSRPNAYGYLGRFQLGEAALCDVGFYNKDDTAKNDWKGKWTNKADDHDVSSRKSFLKNPKAQDYAMFRYMKTQWKYIKNLKLDEAIDSTINGIKITESGLIAAAHLVGVGSVKKYIQSNGKIIPHDKMNTSIEEYISKFGGYDISRITNK